MHSTSESAETASTTTVAAPWLAIAKTLFTWAAVFAMALAIWRSWDFLAAAWSAARLACVLAAIGLWAATHFVSPGFTMLVLGRSKAIDYRSALAVHALRLPAKYLPGGIWHMVGRVTDLKERGHDRSSLIEFVLVENLVAAGFALGVGAALLLVSGEARWRGPLAAVAALAVLGLVLVPWLVKILARTSSMLGPSRYLWLLALSAAFWSVAATAFVVFMAGMGPSVLQVTLPAMVGTYLFSWGAGFIAFFAPQGVGVFEFVAGALLGDRLDLVQAVALMASFRIIVLAGDMLAWLISGLILWRLTPND